MDAQTGHVLQEQNADRVLFPASLSKLMTLFLTFEALENKRIFMDKYMDVSYEATRQPPSKLGLKMGEDITVKQGVYGLITRSANDVAFAMAETVGGNEKNFARMMTQRAHSLGMTHTNFVNPSGLPSPYQQSSARDMAILARAMMQYFPQYYPLFSTESFVYKGQTITNHNNLMKRFPGMDGLKTGYTDASGFNLVASAVRDNRRVIVVMFGGRTAKARDQQVADLMNRGLAMLSRDEMTTQVASADTTNAVEQAKANALAAANSNANPMTPDSHVTQLVSQKTSVQDVIKNSQTTASQQNDFVRNVASTNPNTGAVQNLAIPTAYRAATASAEPISYVTPTTAGGNWGIQVGAYGDPGLGRNALQLVKQQLGNILSSGQPVVIPTRTANGMMYRARLVGLSADNAAKACAKLTDCLAFSVK
jgi:D-alanyl-D-alanine carboxypeptidase